MNKHNGFTLIELMIVVVILSLLGSIAVPSFSSMLNSSRRAELPLNIGGISEAEKSYYAAYDDYLIHSTPLPRAVPSSMRAPWPTGSVFEPLGWAPDGEVRGIYRVDPYNTDEYRVVGQCDVDNDGFLAEFYATFNENVTRVTPVMTF